MYIYVYIYIYIYIYICIYIYMYIYIYIYSETRDLWQKQLSCINHEEHFLFTYIKGYFV